MKKSAVKKISGICLLASLFVLAGCNQVEKDSSPSASTVPCPTTEYVNVTFKGNNEEADKIVEVVKGKTAYAPSISNGDKVFAGWFKDEKCTVAFDFSTAVDQDLTLFAKWEDPEVVTVKITFDYQCDDLTSDEATIAIDTLAYAPADPDRAGYVFGGWYADEDCSLRYVFADAVTTDTTIYAKWVKINTVSFDVETIEDKEVLTGDNFLLPAAPEKEGYHFKGWKVNDQLYQPGTSLTIDVDGDVAICAEYKAVYTVVYYNYDGTILKEYEKEEGDSFEVPEEEVSVPSYIRFVSWNNNQEVVEENSYIYGNYEYTASADKYFNFVGYKVYDSVDDDDQPITVVEPAGEGDTVSFYKISGTTVELDETENGVLVLPKTYNGLPVSGMESGTSTAPTFTTSIQEVVIPNTYKEISNYAFYKNISLEKVTFEQGSTVERIGSYAFANVAWSKLAGTVTEENIAAQKATFSQLSSITIPSSVKTIDTYAFYCNPNLKSVLFEENCSLETIGNYAFAGANVSNKAVGGEGLEMIVIPASVKTIGNYAFAYNAQKSVIFEEGSQLTSIGTYGFAQSNNTTADGDNRARLTSIALPDSLQTLGNYAFYINKSLANVTIGENSSLTSIGNYAFDGSSLTEVSLPDGLESIGTYAFQSTALQEVTIPGTVTSIGNYAFYKCVALRTLTFADGTDDLTIGQYAFAGVAATSSTAKGTPMAIEKVVIPARCVSIDSYAFNANSIKTLEFEEGGSSLTIGTYAFAGAKSASYVQCGGMYSTLSLPSHITSIGDYAFMGNYNLTKVEIPQIASLTSIGNYAFTRCPNIALLTLNDGLQTIGNYAFAGVASTTYNYGDTLLTVNAENSSLTEIVIPASVTSIGNYAFNFYKNIKTITFAKAEEGEEEVTLTIGSNAFFAAGSNVNAALQSLTIPARCVSIGASAFSRMSVMTTLTFEDNSQCTSIGNTAFSGSTKLVTVNFGADNTALLTLGNSVFADCVALKNIVLPDSVTSLGNSCFNGCTSLTSFVIPSSLTSIGSTCFSDCESLESYSISDAGNTVYSVADGILYSADGNSLISIPAKKLATMSEYVAPSTLTEIASYAFDGCENLQKVTLTNVETIGEFAFRNCTALTNVNAPSVTSIGKNAFDGCSLLTTIQTGTVTSLGDYAFRNCSKIETFDVSALKVINAGVFYQTSLTSVTFNDNLTSIGASAFRGTKLKEVSIPASLATLNTGAFTNCALLEKVYIGATSACQVYATPFSNCPSLKYFMLTGTLTGATSSVKSIINNAEIDNFNSAATRVMLDTLVGVYVADGVVASTTLFDNIIEANKLKTWAERPEESKFSFENA